MLLCAHKYVFIIIIDYKLKELLVLQEKYAGKILKIFVDSIKKYIYLAISKYKSTASFSPQFVLSSTICLRKKYSI